LGAAGRKEGENVKGGGTRDGRLAAAETQDSTTGLLIPYICFRGNRAEEESEKGMGYVEQRGRGAKGRRAEGGEQSQLELRIWGFPRRQR